MNIDQLKILANTEPFGRGSTSRFRLAGGTLWYKDDEGYFSPLLSHGGTFVGDWGALPYYSGLNVSSRAHNQMNDLYGCAKRYWLHSLCADDGGLYGDGESDQLVNPAVSIKFDFHKRQLIRVKKPTAAATKMLLMGKHPENGTGRMHWLNVDLPTDTLIEQAKESEDTSDPYRNAFNKPFEEATASLAYGAVSKENLLRDLTQTLSQLKTSLDTSANNMVVELRACADRIFAPDSEEASGTAKPHLHELIRKMKHFRSLARQCSAASDIFANVSAAPDSRLVKVTTPADERWESEWPGSMASFTNLSSQHNWGDPYGCSDTNWSTCALQIQSDSDELTDIPPIRFADHNVRSLSFYWMRRYKEFYGEILGKINCRLRPLFGQAPQDWDYLELAAPIFAAK